ncbi:FAD-dependent oxidoreductase [Bacillus tuaregi]|uniref:FAD-dependent oxidoreductase n=1 Tax=Bacillus tuaregi TaxID=1816695 RepID=UPI0008F8D78E|nr:FAD-dependent oxidoreductase [Bacillus tuaregi]
MAPKRKIAWALVLCFMLLVSLIGCSQSTSDESASGKEALYKAGTYTATASGNNGDVTVEVEFDESNIVSVSVKEHKETPGLSDTPIERIPQGIVDGQTLAVDTVSGATNTSKAILTAVEDCVKQAGGDVDALKTASANDKESKDTELTTDVVVIGGGGAGLAAAASAHQNGAEVIVLEKLAQVGGSTALSGGGISATGTKFQKELGIEDTKESWMSLWKERQATSNPDGMYPDYDFVDKYMDDAVETTEWMVDYIGHEYGAITGFGLDPVERIHFPKTDGHGGGSVLIANMDKFLGQEGIEILTETPAKELIVDDKGNVTGVVAEGKDGKVTVHAEKVILAAGGYAKNEEMLKKYIPEAAGTAELSTASAGSMGDGMNMALEAGAVMYEEPWVIGVGIGSRIEGTGSLGMDWTKMYVNGKGERFANEEMHYAIATNKLIEQDTTWLILDATEANKDVVAAIEAALPSQEAVKADSFEALAEAMKVPADTFVKTMEKYNNGAKIGSDELGKQKDYAIAVETAPYYAIKMYPKTMGTFAGVKTDDDFRVIREDGSVINNLYAVGENANKRLYNQVYMSGSAVQFALTSGRLSGEHAAKAIAAGK